MDLSDSERPDTNEKNILKLEIKRNPRVQKRNILKPYLWGFRGKRKQKETSRNDLWKHAYDQTH
jgi:hypothetical protein